jgi:hypothetical protein
MVSCVIFQKTELVINYKCSFFLPQFMVHGIIPLLIEQHHWCVAHS